MSKKKLFLQALLTSQKKVNCSHHDAAENLLT